jgi:endonuclease/exonuclease/phosphatase (EEP) superfamily protein YafD
MPDAPTSAPPTLTDPRGRRRRWALPLLALPPLGALAGPLLAQLCSEESVEGQMLLAGLLMGPAWAMAAWPAWSLLVWLFSRRAAPCLSAAVLGLTLMGLPPAFWPSGEGGVLVLSTNVNAYSDEADPRTLEAAIAATGADVAIVIEKRATAVPGMRRVADNFQEPMIRVSHATAIFCSDGVPCEARVTPEFGSPTMTMPLAIIRLPGPLCLLGLHGPTPAPKDPTGLMPYMRVVADALEGGRMKRAWAPCAAGDPVALVGDFNSVPHSPALRLLQDRGLRDAFAWTGVWGATWPAGGGWPDAPFFRLDQALLGEVELLSLAHRRMPNTDHKAVLVRIRAGATGGPG